MEHTFLPAPQKRLYIPSFDALFNRNKKRKLPDGTQDAGIQRIEGYSNPMEVYQECIYDEKKRQEVINATIYTQEYKAKPWNSTVPEPFKLHTQERFCKKQDAPKPQSVQNRVIYKARAKAQTTQENGVGFKALPLNKKILQRPDFQPKKTEAKPTQSQEFHLHTEQRAAISQSQTSIDSQSFCPSNNGKGSVKPFKLQTEIRSQIRQQKQTLSQTIEHEVSSFKAQPLPSFYNNSQTSSQSMSQDLDFEHEYSVN